MSRISRLVVASCSNLSPTTVTHTNANLAGRQYSLGLMRVTQACVSHVSAYSDTLTSARAICYKSVTNTAGTGCGQSFVCAAYQWLVQLMLESKAHTWHMFKGADVQIRRCETCTWLICGGIPVCVTCCPLTRHIRRLCKTAAWRLPLRMAWVTHALYLCYAVKAAAQLTPLVLRHGVARPQRCLPARGTSHMMLLTSSSTFSTELLRAVNSRSVRLAGVITWCTCSQQGHALLQHVRTSSMSAYTWCL